MINDNNNASSTYIDFASLFLNPVFKTCLKDFCINLIRKDQDFRQEVMKCSEESLLTCETEPVQRISTIETVLGLNDFADEDVVTIPERINCLEEKIENIEVRPTEKPIVQFKQDTTTGRRAMGIITALRDSGKDHLTHKEIKSILTGDKMEEDKIDIHCKNPRKTIIDALKEATTICSDVFLDQKNYGRKEWRLVLKRNST
jgi:hypothetical protein